MQLTRSSLRHRRVWLLLGSGMIAGVVVLSLIPIQVDMVGGDKLAHFFAYGSLSLWFGMIFSGKGRQLGIAAGFAAMGATLEFLQGMTGYRSFEIADMAANAIGAVLGWGLAQTPLNNALAWVERVFFPPP